jgi:REP element-mobilizing transposase RayT
VAAYHCVTRAVNRERLFDPAAREILRRQIWLVADFCGVQVVTYAILSNHFHVLVRVPQRAPVSDEELLRRYRVLYPRPTTYQVARMGVVCQQLASDGPEATDWRRRQLARMGDISAYMKLVKQRFSIWFNKSHQRVGTLWCERFKSVVVEDSPRALQTMALYIDLNAVRAGLAADPKDYRFCGYAEAVGGNVVARAGLAIAVPETDWSEVQAAYRMLLFGTGAGPKEFGGGISGNALAAVLRSGGRLPLATVLRCRLRFLSDGAVFGSKAFVAMQLEEYRRRTGRRERTDPRHLPPLTDWGDLATMRNLRGGSIG